MQVATVKRKMNFTNVTAITKQIEEGQKDEDITIEELEALPDDNVADDAAITEKEKIVRMLCVFLFPK